jgi:serine/threonine protein kinase
MPRSTEVVAESCGSSAGLEAIHEPRVSGTATAHVDALAAAWARGEQLTAAALFERHPGLGAEASIRLIYEEVCLRREAGLGADTTEVVCRYPRWADELRALFECDRLFRPQSGCGAFPEVGESLGPFRLLAELGRGAAGRTYLASDPGLADRPVVVKVIPGDQNEHLALARLRHTHIVPLFSEHSFPERGLRGLCMPFLGGASLAQIFKGMAAIPIAQRTGKLIVELIDRNSGSVPVAFEAPFRRALEQASYVQAMTWVAACLADALHYAHARGLVHMDVKPSNVLIGADGQPMLLDFHLARAPILPGEWVTDRLGGTPGWLSPEQRAAMDAVENGRPPSTGVDGRTDIFALGVLLHEAMGLPCPAQPGRTLSVESRAVVSTGLADILRKCVAPHPGDRYQEAATLADDLRRHLNDQPLRGVRNRSPRERWRKWQRRNPGALASMIARVSLLFAASVVPVALVTVHTERVSQLEGALDEGRRARADGKYDAAIDMLERGLKSAGHAPGISSLKRALGEEIVLAQRGRLADELHELADRVRFAYGIDLPEHGDATTLANHCRSIWERRDRLAAAGGSLGSEPSQRTKTDLLELAAVWADLRIRLAPVAEETQARREVLQLLDDADAAYGPSLAIALRRESLADPEPHAPDGERGPARAPRSAWEHYDLGRYLLRSGQIEGAAAEFEQTLALRPDDFWSNFYKGLCAFRLKRFDESVAAFTACTALMPHSAICRYNRALAYESLGRNEAAVNDLTGALRLDRGLTPALLNRGILAHKSGRDRDAVSDFERALSTHPDHETQGQLHYNLALAELARNNLTSAHKHAEEAARIGCPGAASLVDKLAQPRP